MMATSPMSSSIKLCVDISVLKGKNLSHIVQPVATSTAVIPRTTNATHEISMRHQMITNVKITSAFKELSLRPTRSVLSERIPIKDPSANGNLELKSIKVAQEFNREVDIIVRRLEAVAKRVTELEIEKFKRRIKGELSSEDSILAETMTREIVDKILEKPTSYLRSSCGNMEDKIKEINLLVSDLEESCLTKEKRKVNA